MLASNGCTPDGWRVGALCVGIAPPFAAAQCSALGFIFFNFFLNFKVMSKIVLIFSNGTSIELTEPSQVEMTMRGSKICEDDVPLPDFWLEQFENCTSYEQIMQCRDAFKECTRSYALTVLEGVLLPAFKQKRDLLYFEKYPHHKELIKSCKNAL